MRLYNFLIFLSKRDVCFLLSKKLYVILHPNLKAINYRLKLKKE